MIQIEIIADSPKDLLEQIQEQIGGVVTEQWSEYTLKLNNKFGIGSIKFIPFDWGFNLLEFQIKFDEEIDLKIKSIESFNPIRFIYASKVDITSSAL